MKDSFFRNIESKTGVPMEEVFALANAIQYADFSDERQVRKIIRNVGKLANKNVPAIWKMNSSNLSSMTEKRLILKILRIC